MEAIVAGKDPFREAQSGRKFRFFPFAILLGLLVGIAGVWSSNKEVLGLFHDDGIYAVVAKSLSDGVGYRLISLPTAPDQTKYPFLYSYILSWLWSLDPKFPENIGLLKAANAAFLAGVFILSYLFYRRRVPGEESEGLLFAALVCINPVVFPLQISRLATSCSFAFSLGFGIFRCLRAVHFAPKQHHTIGSYCWFRLFDSIRSDTTSSGWSCSFRLEQALSRFDTLRMPSASLIVPWWIWVRGHSNQTASSLLHIMFRTVRNPPRLWLCGPIPRGLEIVWGNRRYIVEALDMIFQSRIVPGLLLPVGLMLLWGMGGH